MSQILWLRQWLFSPANQWSAEFTRHILVMVRFACNLNRGGTEKSTRYQVLDPVENTPKVSCTVPYHAVEKHHKKRSFCHTLDLSVTHWISSQGLILGSVVINALVDVSYDWYIFLHLIFITSLKISQSVSPKQLSRSLFATSGHTWITWWPVFPALKSKHREMVLNGNYCLDSCQ